MKHTSMQSLVSEFPPFLGGTDKKKKKVSDFDNNKDIILTFF